MKNFLLAFTLTSALLFLVLSAPASARSAPTAARLVPLTPEAVNDAGSTARPGPKSKRAALLRAQVLLDRVHFSSGEIDASSGSNLKKAIVAFQKSNGFPPTGTLDRQTWMALNQDSAPVLIEYTITAADVAGPFSPIPADLTEKSKLPALGFTSPAEALGEKFHASPKLLQQLNGSKNLGLAGEVIVVPSVEPVTPLPKGARLIVNKNQSTINLLDASGRILAHYPASIGSKHDPLPLGNWKVLGVARNPSFRYNPKLFWDADPNEKATRLPPGPNNPVGVVWIDLSKPHYGIHGTPEPSTIGKTQSHGCIRLTNWDAATLAEAVFPGMPAILQE